MQNRTVARDCETGTLRAKAAHHLWVRRAQSWGTAQSVLSAWPLRARKQDFLEQYHSRTGQRAIARVNRSSLALRERPVQEASVVPGRQGTQYLRRDMNIASRSESVRCAYHCRRRAGITSPHCCRHFRHLVLGRPFRFSIRCSQGHRWPFGTARL